MAGNELRIATLNAFGTRADWQARRAIMAAGFADLCPDVIAFQEVIASDDYDQVRDIMGDGYHVVHHSEREADGQGISIASRWPVRAVHEVDLHLGPRPAGFACSALLAEINAPGHVGPTMVVNFLPDWQLSHEAERERQAVAVARLIEDLRARGLNKDEGGSEIHVLLAGDMDASPDSATIRFWTGKQSLQDLSICYRDAWIATNPGQDGHTFTPENRLTTSAEAGEWELELGRRIDYLLVRCNDHGPTLRIKECQRLFDKAINGVWTSDHFGLTALLSAVTAADGLFH